MKKNIIELEEYGIEVDEEQIKSMSKEELQKCKEKIQEIQKILEK